MTGLKPEIAVPTGVTVAAVVYGVYANMTPTLADIRHADPQDPNIASSRKAAAWTSAAIVAGISLLAKDPTIFIIGSFAVVAIDFLTRHANEVNPATGTASVRAAQDAAQDAGYTIPEGSGDFAPAYN